jgi:hypothetical protein
MFFRESNGGRKWVKYTVKSKGDISIFVDKEGTRDNEPDAGRGWSWLPVHAKRKR